MDEDRRVVAEMFLEAIVTIAARTVSQPNAWERYQLFEALVAIEADDIAAARMALRHFGRTPTIADLRAVWQTPRLSLEQIRVHFDRVKGALE
jgi:hypothetical protein